MTNDKTVISDQLYRLVGWSSLRLVLNSYNRNLHTNYINIYGVEVIKCNNLILYINNINTYKVMNMKISSNISTIIKM